MEHQNDDVVLIIEDDQISLKVIVDTLKSAGMTSIVASSGEMGIKQALLAKPDLILLDIMMPGLDGFETCHLLKAAPETQAIPILFLTALNDEGSKVKGFGAGGVDFITKPIGKREMLARVKTHLNLKRKQELLERLVAIDGLTEIPNRRQFDNVLDKEWMRAQRAEKPLSLILVDIDYFKKFNDYYGHTFGDECLRKVAQALAHTVKRSSDFAARYGGEEFAAILPETPVEPALEIAERIRVNVESLNISHASSLVSSYVTLSLGVATLLPTQDASPGNLIEMADTALYQAKAGGRNRIRHTEDTTVNNQ